MGIRYFSNILQFNPDPPYPEKVYIWVLPATGEETRKEFSIHSINSAAEYKRLQKGSPEERRLAP